MRSLRFSACLLIAAVAVLLGAAEGRSSVLFGDTTYRASTTSIEDNIVGGVFTCDSNGIADSISAWLHKSDADTWTICFGLYAWNGGTNPSYVGKTTSTGWSSSSGSSFKTLAFEDPKPFLVAGRYVICAWSEDIAEKALSLRVGSLAGDTIVIDPQTYALTWPDPMVKSHLNGYRASIACWYTPCTKMILSDSTSLCLGQIAPASPSQDTINVNADGDTVAWTASSGADYTCVDETTPSTTDYVSDAISPFTELFNIANDTTYAGTLDSMKIVLYAKAGGIANSTLYFLIDTTVAAGGRTVLNSASLPNNNSWAYYTSQNIAGITRTQLAVTQIGFRGYPEEEEGAITVAWVALRIYVSAPAQDVWADSLLKVGSVKATHAQRETRLLLSLRNTDSIGYYNPNGTGWYQHLAYLKIQTDSIKPATTRYLVSRLVLPQGTTNASRAVKWAAANAASYAHSNWSYWSSSDTAWNVAGADSADRDWCYNYLFDSIAVTQNATVTVNITPWIQALNALPDSMRHQGAGLLFYLSQEDSTADAWVKLGNVQPAANVDSTWIELYRIPSNVIGLEGGSCTGESFGYYTPVLTSTYGIEDYIRSYSAKPTGDGDADAIWVYLSSSAGTYTYSVRCALYRYMGLGNPDTLYGLTDSAMVAPTTTGGWYQFPFSGTKPKIWTDSLYLIAAMARNNTSANINIRRGGTAPLPNRLVSGSATYPTWPSPWTPSATQATYMDIYCCYSAAGAPTDPPIGTLMMMGIGRSLPRHPFAERVRNYMNQEVE